MPSVGMLSKILMGMLAAEALLLGLVSFLLLHFGLLGEQGVTVLCVTLPLGWRLMTTINMFRASERHRMKRAPEQEIGRAAFARMLLAEYACVVGIFTWLHPFEWLHTRRGALGAGGLPILCVHGYVCNGGYWASMRAVLARSGHGRSYTLNMDPTFGSIETFAAAVARRVDEILAETGESKVILLGHSMGGLVSRCYVQRHGGVDKVSRIVTLGTPHHGTVSAYGGFGEDARQMRPSDAWLKALNAEPPVDVPITSIYTFHDNIVFPQDTSVLPGAKNIGLPGIGHLELAFSPAVQRLVLEEMREAKTTL
ncbi:MAG: hypothetical protein RLZZ303_3400 [Candidatus Hydrogenedentota bacterium]